MPRPGESRPQLAEDPNRLQAAGGETRAVLAATLGAEGQVVTLATQLLLQAGVALERVVVLHTAAGSEPIASALADLGSAFAGQPGWPPLTMVDAGMGDVLEPDDLAGFTGVLYSELKRWLSRGRRVHLLLAGGRKQMAMMGVTVAQMLFGPEDRVWHLYSDEALRQSNRFLLGAGDEARLIPIPLVRWSLAPPILTGLAAAASPLEALAWQQEQLNARRRDFLDHMLTAAEREVALAAIQTGATDLELARRLYKSPRTISHQMAAVYDKLRLFLAVRPDVRVDRHTLISEFAALAATPAER